MTVEIEIPRSETEAVAAYGDGSDVTVIGGGTIVMQLLNSHRLKPAKALLLGKAGLSYVRESGNSLTIGAATPLSDLVDLPAPLGPCAANVGDNEIRGQATLGGNLCSPTPPDHPSGDLQGPLIAVCASVRSVGPRGETTESITEFLTHRASRLVLDVTFEKPEAGAFAAFRRPHTHHFTPLAVSGATGAGGSVSLAVTGANEVGVRLPKAEGVADDPESAGQAAVSDVEMKDDALLSAWYRARLLPILVRRVLAAMREDS